MSDPLAFGNSPVIPVDPDSVRSHMVHFVSYANSPVISGLQPFEYTGWKDEERSWHDTCYIHSNLNPSPTYRFGGPDSIEFLKKYVANTFKPFPVGLAKHGIMCDKEGRDMIDGIPVRIMRVGMAGSLAYEVLADGPHRSCVTLVWNKEDILDIQRRSLPTPSRTRTSTIPTTSPSSLQNIRLTGFSTQLGNESA